MAGLIGRNPTPTQAKINAGNPGGKAIRKDEPKPVLLDDLRPPKQFLFSPLAIKVWNELAPSLRQAKMLAETDRLYLANLCNATAELFAADKEVADLWTKGKWDSMGGGKGKAFSPRVSIRNAALDRFEKAAAMTGINAAARARLTEIKTQTDLFDDINESEDDLMAQIKQSAESLGVVVDFKRRQA